MKADAPDPPPPRGRVVERYEELRGAILGQRAGSRWGLNVLYQGGLAAWSRAVPASDGLAPAAGRPRTMPAIHSGPSLPDHQDLVPLIARMIAASFWQEVAR